MNLKTSVFLCIGAAAAIATPARAEFLWDMYTGVSMGIGAQTVFQPGGDDTHSAQSFGALFGFDIPFVRAELEYDYLHEYDSRANLGMFNAYFKIPALVIKPYVGGGFGMLFAGRDSARDMKFDTTLAYQAMLGVTLDVPKLPFKFDVEGRALYVPDICTRDGGTPDLLHYEARFKLRYVF